MQLEDSGEGLVLVGHCFHLRIWFVGRLNSHAWRVQHFLQYQPQGLLTPKKALKVNVRLRGLSVQEL